MMPKPARRRIKESIARLDTERTDTLRELHPDLSWVWDELDELRDLREESVPYDEWEELDDRADGMFDDIDHAVDVLEKLVSDEDMSDDVQTGLESLSERLSKRIGR